MTKNKSNLVDIQINRSVEESNTGIESAILVSFASNHNVPKTWLFDDQIHTKNESSDDSNEDNYFESEEKNEPLELELLAKSAGADIASIYIRKKRFHPNAATFLSKGHIENIQQLVTQYHASVVIFDHTLSPIQERNLEKEWQCRVIDRTRLILDIFALRAATKEGKLQVELAQLKYISTRLVRGWTHLERQKGGIGLRGPGETQLETDRRLIRQRIHILEKRLEKVNSQRALRRKQRERKPISTVSLVGYTNAGKSSLFNKITTADVYVKDQLFATLDPTMRRLDLESGEVILTDTVGFVRDLPHSLVKAFHATLEEIAKADLLLHVVDISNEEHQLLAQQVEEVLEEIDAQDIPVIYVYNKIDKADISDYPPSLQNKNSYNTSVYLSAHSGVGLDVLKEKVNEFFNQKFIHKNILVKAKDGKLRSVLYKQNWAKNELALKNGDMDLEISLSEADWGWLNHHFEIVELN